MTPLDIARAHEAICAASRGAPRAPYPVDPVTAYAEAAENRKAAIPIALAEAAERLLIEAARAEARARAVEQLAVDALRHLGPASASWVRIGEHLGVSGQGAHKRFAASVERPRAALTFDDLAAEGDA